MHIVNNPQSLIYISRIRIVNCVFVRFCRGGLNIYVNIKEDEYRYKVSMQYTKRYKLHTIC